MTQTQLEYAIASGQFTVTVLPTRFPRKSELICSRVGGARSRFYAATGSGRNGIDKNKQQQFAK